MNHEPFAQHPSEPAPASPSLADLLAARPSAEATAHRNTTPHAGDSGQVRVFAPPLHPVAAAEQAAAKADMTDAAPAPLLLVHAGLPEGALAQTWLNHVLEGAQPSTIHFDDRVEERAQELLRSHSLQAVLIQFEPRSLEQALELSAQLHRVYPHIPRIAVGRTRYPECMLAALRSGVQDFLDIDGPVQLAMQTVSHILSRPVVNQAAHQPRAARTALLSARAGVGCSLLAAHLAWYLQQRLASQPHAEDDALHTLLVDLGTPGGDSAIYLNTPGEFSLADAVSQQRRLDRRMAQSALARHDSGLRLLAQQHPAHAIAAEDVQSMLARLSQYFGHVILDMGAADSGALMSQVLPEVDEIWVVCEQSVASVVWTMELLKQLGSLHIPRDRVRLLVGRHDARLELTAQHIAEQLQIPLLAVIPERRRELTHAVNQGGLLDASHQREPYVLAVDKLLGTLVAEHHPELAPVAAAPTSPLARLLQRLRPH